MAAARTKPAPAGKGLAAKWAHLDRRKKLAIAGGGGAAVLLLLLKGRSSSAATTSTAANQAATTGTTDTGQVSTLPAYTDGTAAGYPGYGSVGGYPTTLSDPTATGAVDTAPMDWTSIAQAIGAAVGGSLPEAPTGAVASSGAPATNGGVETGPSAGPVATGATTPKPSPIPSKPIGYPPAYTGGAKVVKVEHLANGATLTTTATGAVIEQAPGHTPYQVKAPTTQQGSSAKTSAPATAKASQPAEKAAPAPAPKPSPIVAKPANAVTVAATTRRAVAV